VNDLDFVVRTVDLLWSHGAKTWVFGSWGEELRGLVPPQQHTELELLYPARDWQRIDELELDWVAAGHERWQRTFQLESVIVELLLVERGERGWLTSLPRRLHEWPDDVFSANGRIPVASAAALAGYPAARRRAA
jgi:hypothetical protein